MRTPVLRAASALSTRSNDGALGYNFAITSYDNGWPP
jgi:hypothetical protein